MLVNSTESAAWLGSQFCKPSPYLRCGHLAELLHPRGAPPFYRCGTRCSRSSWALVPSRTQEGTHKETGNSGETQEEPPPGRTVSRALPRLTASPWGRIVSDPSVQRLPHNPNRAFPPQTPREPSLLLRDSRAALGPRSLAPVDPRLATLPPAAPGSLLCAAENSPGCWALRTGQSAR